MKKGEKDQEKNVRSNFLPPTAENNVNRFTLSKRIFDETKVGSVTIERKALCCKR